MPADRFHSPAGRCPHSPHLFYEISQLRGDNIGLLQKYVERELVSLTFTKLPLSKLLCATTIVFWDGAIELGCNQPHQAPVLI
ncbi:hypothetical protein PG999_010556 [Apiospora kogelbergensis]|uniref:Uncharacterized protein n=1 Tax=Apiospora kogelbergensis TaxID=1337665 RepID=A0AAW0QI71_9PEZI